MTIDGFVAIWPGDTDALAFHENLYVDLFLPPIGGAFTMDRFEAAAIDESIDSGLVLPIHSDSFDELETGADAFVVDVASHTVPVVLDAQKRDR